jgi:FkbM family methyltransferase
MPKDTLQVATWDGQRSQALSKEIAHHLASASILPSRGGDGEVLHIDGHRPVSWPPTAARHREETVILLLSFLIGRLHPRVFFDIGSASGDYTCLAISHVASPPHVHAFDIRPEAHATLRARVAEAGPQRLVTPHMAGLSERHEGEKDLWFARTRLFEHEPEKSEYQEMVWRRLKFFLLNRHRGPVKTRAEITSIDHLATVRGIVPDLLKIDVDGYEGKVLRGGLQTFARYRPPVMLELHKDKLLNGERRSDVVGILLDIGYEALFLTDHHDPKACRIVPVGRNHPLLARQETDFILFC